MQKPLRIALIILGIFFLFTSVASAKIDYNYYEVDSLEDGPLDSCTNTLSQKCFLNSAIDAAETLGRDTVILVNLPFESIGGKVLNNSKDTMPFYLIKERAGETITWKLFQAPITSSTSLSNVQENITDYFLSINGGFVKSFDTNTFLGTLFYGQFKKYYPDENPGEYDFKYSFYRILDLPQNSLQFSNAEEASTFIKQASSGNLVYQKVFLNGWHLRIYEDSFSRAVLLLVFLVSILLAALNFLLFPNLALYLLLRIRARRETKVIGLIYDKYSSEPISFASIKIYNNANGQKVFLQQVISDIDGKYYGFALNRGIYLLEILKDGYKPYEETVEVFQDEGIIAGDSGLSKSETVVNKNLMRRVGEWVVNHIKKFNLTIGVINLVISILNLLIAQNLLNVLILAIALVQYIFLRRINRKREWGVVLDGQTGEPIQNAFVKVYDPKDYKQLDVKLTDTKGRFGFILRQSEYLISVKAFGYRYPSVNDKNEKSTSNSGEILLKLKIGADSKLSIKVLLDKDIQ